ncbi:branched-chain alpha-keto acid dehydrogenase E1-alpha subunit [Fistulina hepatica ATCC 64428]|uniref:2-oxoisovalerate dehydrogenase subunit alpha n=1 Tax=Fistulina hepatica ATCC 64428 TaxID=1128425 RepID=A0A0D7A483_9AGAR|nr:branched-chain alpha-keto acid dehydrogenase E1-alpha subunit [Fistulina hepatica ATCC 64428]
MRLSLVPLLSRPRRLPNEHSFIRYISSSGSRPSSPALGVARSAPTLGHLPNTQSPFTVELEFFNSVGRPIPTYRVLDGLGDPLENATLPELDENYAKKLYEHMQLLPALDNLLYNVQRQGKISFYMTSHGEEAAVIGAAAGLQDDDEVLSQYREMGVLLWRGFGLDAIMGQCIGNENDKSGKGRQMPVHLGSPAHHFHTVSSTLATQAAHAAGVGFALRRTPERRERSIAVCFTGEGAASEGDFHAGLQLASTIPAPVLYFVRNNGFAISTPSTEQYHGDGIASRGPGYGTDTIRVDGNDVLAVLIAVRAARKRCLEQGRAVLVEAMTYRVGHHSTSDDSFAYRARAEVEDRKRIDNPLARMRRFLESRGWWDAAAEAALKARLKSDVLTAFKRAEMVPRHPIGELFTDVYGGEEPWNLREQRAELTRLLKKYGQMWEPWRKELDKFREQGRDLTEDK